MDLDQLAQELQGYLQDHTLLAAPNLETRARATALIRLIQEAARTQRHWPGLLALLQQAGALHERIELVNQQLFQELRQQIALGQWHGTQLANLLRRFTPLVDISPATLYYQPDSLDRLISGAFALEKGPTAHQALKPGMVHYERTPARLILTLVERVKFAPELVFYDLGSGLGEVPMLVHLLTGVQTKGVEIEAAFCRYAQQQIASLQLNGVTILNADARNVDYSDGDIFFMFTPFYGAVLQEVLDRLRQQAQWRVLTLCTYGPCTPVVAQQPWLAPVVGTLTDEFALAIFRTT